MNYNKTSLTIMTLCIFGAVISNNVGMAAFAIAAAIFTLGDALAEKMDKDND